MIKTRVSKSMIETALLIVAVAAMLIFKSATGAQGNSFLNTGRGDYQRYETQQLNAAGETSENSAVSPNNCFSASFHAATDCDRLASSVTLADPAFLGPTTSSCFSNPYHAASDCDRITSNIPPVLVLSPDLTAANCYSGAFHAASDCDRLATEISVASKNR